MSSLLLQVSTFLFTLLSLPNNITHLVSTYHSTFGYRKADYYFYRTVSRFCYLALISTRYTNFFSYLGLSTAFRRNLIRGILPRQAADKLLGLSPASASGRGGQMKMTSGSVLTTTEESKVARGDGGRVRSETCLSVVSSSY